MKIVVMSILVDDQDRALRFYTSVLGFVKKTEVPMGEARWLTVVSPDDPGGVELSLEPDGHPAVRPFKRALIEDSHAVDVAGDGDEGSYLAGSQTYDLVILDILLPKKEGPAILKELLTNEPALPLEIDASAREVLTEVGNILLNACLGTFGNLLHVQVTFSVPHLTLETLEGVVGSITVNREGLRYAMIVHAAFRLRNTGLKGFLVIVLSVASIERLIRAIEQWERDQH